jgi:hypothetical protein
VIGKLLRLAVILIVCMKLVVGDPPARADEFHELAVAVVVVAVAVGAAIGIGIYFAFHHAASIKGCVAGGPGGLEIKNEGDQLEYLLSGDTSQVKAGDVVRVKGKKKSAKGGSAHAMFVVNTFAKDYGACHASPTANP